jgi:hypothetical protein
MTIAQSENETAALALLKRYAAKDLEAILAAQNVLGRSTDHTERRAAIRDCLDDLERNTQ